MTFTEKDIPIHSEYISPAEEYTDVFTIEELKELEYFMFRRTKHYRYSNTGNLFFSGNFKELFKEFIEHKVENILDTSIISTVSGNFFHTPHQYGIHTDMPEPDNTYDDNHYVYKNILIPLYKLPEASNLKMIFYDQRVVDNGCTLDYDKFKSTTHYRSFTDYSLIENVFDVHKNSIKIGNTPMSQEEFKKHELNYAPSPIERYTGLTVENSFDWLPRSMYIFDTSQIHSSTLGKPKFITKGGLRLSLIRKVT